MQLDSTEDAITYFLTHVVPTNLTGVDDPVNRERAARFLQTKVAQYWEPPWKIKEAVATVTFSSGEGVAGMPNDFSTWDRNFGLLVWGPPATAYSYEFNPTQVQTLDVMRLRSQFPTRTGTPIAVARHAGLLKRWPTLPPGGVPETCDIYYHRRRPNILDLFDQEDPEPEDPQDEWALIPVDDQEVLIDGLRAMWESVAADGREALHETVFRKRVRELYRSRNQDEQPSKFSQPFNAGRTRRPYRVGDRYYT